MSDELKSITAEDWIIIRLIVLCMEEGKKRPRDHIDLFKSIVYLYKKYGAGLTGEAYQLMMVDQIHKLSDTGEKP